MQLRCMQTAHQQCTWLRCATNCYQLFSFSSSVRLVAAVSDMMAADPKLWQHRPLSSQLQQYAAADVSQLLSLASILASKLGEAGQDTVLALSHTSSRLKLPIKLATQVLSNSAVRQIVCACHFAAAQIAHELNAALSSDSCMTVLFLLSSSRLIACVFAPHPHLHKL